LKIALQNIKRKKRENKKKRGKRERKGKKREGVGVVARGGLCVDRRSTY
jgi:hypothetical protein